MFASQRHGTLPVAVTVVALAALALPSGAGQDADQPVLLRLKFTPMAITKYRTSLKMQLHVPIEGAKVPKLMQVDALTRQIVLKVNPDGSAELKTTVISQQTTLDGVVTPTPTPDPITTTYDPRGAVLKLEGLPDSNPFAKVMSKIMGGSSTPVLYLPKDPVKPGDSWTSPISVPGIITDGTVKSTFVRYDSAGALRTAVIHTEADLPMTLDASMLGPQAGATGLTITAKCHMESDTNFDVAGGKAAKTGGIGDLQMHITLPPAVAAQFPNGLDMTMKMIMDLTLAPVGATH